MADDPINADTIMAQALEAAGLARNKAINHPHYVTSSEPLAWELKGLVRVDVVVMALRLMTWRITTRSLPGMIRQRLFTYKRLILESVVEFAVKKVATAAFGKLISRIKIAADVWVLDRMEAEKESGIRRAAIAAMRDVFKNRMKSKKKKRRRVKSVASRHQTPKRGQW